jgi:endonuclease YncB( thermonuclease family)
MPMHLLLLLLPLFAHAETFRGKVVGVSDGDTVKVLHQVDGQITPEKIRLLGIDAPEKKQPFGPQSKEALSAKIFGREVEVEWKKKDRYGRTLGKIKLDGRDMNLAQIEEGLAWHYGQYRKEEFPGDADLYDAAEVKARDAKIGLWSATTAKAPWEYRRARRVAASEAKEKAPKKKKHSRRRKHREEDDAAGLLDELLSY